ncbi:MAG TPA: hypothetical protein VGG72_21385 [Bryobacteraceae bacterium]|jgi:hypothetical protein
MRRFIYLYNQREQDIEDDPSGTIETPSVGSIISRREKQFRVIHVIAPVSTDGTTPIVRVFLNDVARGMNRNSRVKYLPK